MSETKNLKTVVRYELLKQVRRRRFYGALGITLFAILLTMGLYQGLNLPERMGLPAQLLERYDAEIFAMFVTSLSSLAVLGAVFFAGDSIASEFEQRTGYILFPNPVRRSTIVMGKYLACLIATAAIIAAAYLTSAIGLALFYGRIPSGIVGSMAIALILGAMVISLAFLFSSLLKGSVGSTIGTLLTYMVVFATISTFLSYAGYDPWFMPDRAADAMSATYGISLEEMMSGTYGGGRWVSGLLRASQDPVLSFFVLAAYACVFLVLSVVITNRREMV